MARSLSPDAVDAYRRDGYLFPIDIVGADEAATWRRRLQAIEARYEQDASLPRPLDDYMRRNAHLTMPSFAQLALDPRILDAVESLLGPDLLVWSAEFFIKPAKSDKIVSWHQDLTYWGLGATDHEVTAWLALSPVTRQSGCMRFVAGSHNNDIVAHADTFAEDNLLSRGQEIAVEVDEDSTTDVVLMPGQMSLHHGRMFHASGPNSSDDRRIGFVMRFITPDVRQEVGQRDYAMLARGMDRFGNFVHIRPPDRDFDPYALELYEEIDTDEAAILAQGTDVPLYQQAAGGRGS